MFPSPYSTIFKLVTDERPEAQDHTNTHGQFVGSPAELLHYESPSTQDNSETMSRAQLELEILKPLQYNRVLEACREHSVHRTLPPPEGNPSAGAIVQEVLDLEPLFREWRSACASFPINESKPQRFIFNINPPQEHPDIQQAGPIIWNHSRAAGLCVVEERISRFVHGIATVMRVRSQGKPKFSLVGADEYRMASFSPRADGYFRNLEKVLEDLSSKD